MPGLIIFGLAEEKVRLRTTLNLLGAVSKLALVGLMLWGVFHEHHYETRLALLPGLELVLRAGPLALLFVTLSTVLWLLTTVYAIGYLEGSPHRSRFFGFFSLCVTATVGVALAGNLITFVLFYGGLRGLRGYGDYGDTLPFTLIISTAMIMQCQDCQESSYLGWRTM